MNILGLIVLGTIYLLVCRLGLDDGPAVVASGGLIAARNGLALGHAEKLVLVLGYSLSVLGRLYS